MVYINMSKMIHIFALGSSLRNKRTLGVSKSLIDLSELLVQNLYNINKGNLEIDPQISPTCCTALRYRRKQVHCKQCSSHRLLPAEKTKQTIDAFIHFG